MMCQHAAFPHRQTKFKPIAMTSGQTFAWPRSVPSLCQSSSRMNHHKHALITAIAAIRNVIASRRLKLGTP